MPRGGKSYRAVGQTSLVLHGEDGVGDVGVGDVEDVDGADAPHLHGPHAVRVAPAALPALRHRVAGVDLPVGKPHSHHLVPAGAWTEAATQSRLAALAFLVQLLQQQQK